MGLGGDHGQDDYTVLGDKYVIKVVLAVQHKTCTIQNFDLNLAMFQYKISMSGEEGAPVQRLHIWLRSLPDR